MSTSTATPAWYTDPTGQHHLRYWDGARWTAYVSDHGDTTIETVATPAPPAAPVEADAEEQLRARRRAIWRRTDEIQTEQVALAQRLDAQAGTPSTNPVASELIAKIKALQTELEALQDEERALLDEIDTQHTISESRRVRTVKT